MENTDREIRKTFVQMLTLLLVCVALGKVLSISELQFLPMTNGDRCSTYLIGLV